MISNIDLHDAICSGDVEEVQGCLDNGAQLNQLIEGVPPLTFAIRNGEEDIAIFLIEHGADISLEPTTEKNENNNEDTKNELLADRSTLEVAWQSSVNNFILCLIHEWSREVALSELWLSILCWARWPSLQTPYLMTILANTLFGFNIRSLAFNFVGAIWDNNVGPFVLLSLRVVPTYLIMFILARRTAVVNTGRDTLRPDWDLWRAVTLSYKIPLWRVEGFIMIVVQEILWYFITAFRFRSQRASSGAKFHGGTSALEAIFAYDGSCQRVAYALLDHGIFSEDYVRKSLWDYPQYSERATTWEPERSHVRRFWTWSLDSGNEQIVSKLLELGVSTNEPSRHGHPLVHAVALGYENVANLLLQQGQERNDYVSDDIYRALVASASGLGKRTGSEASLASEDRLFYQLLERARHVNFSDKSGSTALSYAVSAENIPAIKALIQKGANANKTDKKGKSPIFGLQSNSSAVPVLELLLEAGANINHQDDEGYTILLYHAQVSNTKAVRLLLKNGADPKIRLHDGRTAMELAARYCMSEMIQDLLDAGASVNDASAPTSSPLILASHCHYERAEALRLLLDNGANPNDVDHNGKTPLHLVCHQPSSGKDRDLTDDHMESLTALIDAGADVSQSYKAVGYDELEYEVTALGIVAKSVSDKSKYHCLKALLDAGASPNAYGSSFIGHRDFELAIVSVCQNAPDIEGFSRHGQSQMNCTELLLDHGADLHYRDKKDMALWHHAASGNNFQAAGTLFDRGLDINTNDVYGRSPLHLSCDNMYWMTTENYDKWEDAGMYSGSQEYAAWHCSIESSITMMGLFAAGAMTTAQDRQGCTPMHIAAKSGNPRILSMLLLYAGGSQIYDYPDVLGRLPFHHGANSAEATHVLLHWYLCQQVESNRYYQVLDPPPQNISSMANEFGGKIWEEVLKRRYCEAHPDEIIEDDAPIPPWRRNMINARDKFGNTPLHYAALVGNVDVVRQYLELPHIDLSIVNKDGESALDLSRIHRECAIAIAEKCLEVGIEVSGDELGAENMTSQCRIHAQRFVDGLQEKYRYGVYLLE